MNYKLAWEAWDYLKWNNLSFTYIKNEKGELVMITIGECRKVIDAHN